MRAQTTKFSIVSSVKTERLFLHRWLQPSEKSMIKCPSQGGCSPWAAAPTVEATTIIPTVSSEAAIESSPSIFMSQDALPLLRPWCTVSSNCRKRSRGWRLLKPGIGRKMISNKILHTAFEKNKNECLLYVFTSQMPHDWEQQVVRRFHAHSLALESWSSRCGGWWYINTHKKTMTAK